MAAARQRRIEDCRETQPDSARNQKQRRHKSGPEAGAVERGQHEWKGKCKKSSGSEEENGCVTKASVFDLLTGIRVCRSGKRGDAGEKDSTESTWKKPHGVRERHCHRVKAHFRAAARRPQQEEIEAV